jgi:hypothetical protein
MNAVKLSQHAMCKTQKKGAKHGRRQGRKKNYRTKDAEN